MERILPGRPAPELAVETLDGAGYALDRQQPEAFSLVIFYRGLHCPICKKYLSELETKVGAFEQRGVEPIAVSSDTRERAEKAAQDWTLERLKVGYGMPIEAGRKWGLFVSRSIKEGEPREFLEPGLFLIRPDATVYAGSIATMPFARPPLDEVLSAIDFVLKNDYPPRGEA